MSLKATTCIFTVHCSNELFIPYTAIKNVPNSPLNFGFWQWGKVLGEEELEGSSADSERRKEGLALAGSWTPVFEALLIN